MVFIHSNYLLFYSGKIALKEWFPGGMLFLKKLMTACTKTHVHPGPTSPSTVELGLIVGYFFVLYFK